MRFLQTVGNRVERGAAMRPFVIAERSLFRGRQTATPAPPAPRRRLSAHPAERDLERHQQRPLTQLFRRRPHRLVAPPGFMGGIIGGKVVAPPHDRAEGAVVLEAPALGQRIRFRAPRQPCLATYL